MKTFSIGKVENNSNSALPLKTVNSKKYEMYDHNFLCLIRGIFITFPFLVFYIYLPLFFRGAFLKSAEPLSRMKSTISARNRWIIGHICHPRLLDLSLLESFSCFFRGAFLNLAQSL